MATNPVTVTSQPQDYDVYTAFNLTEGEKKLHEWKGHQYCFEICGSNYLTLTNKRLLIRHEKHGIYTRLCKCCCSPAYYDSSNQLEKLSNLNDGLYPFMGDGLGLCLACCIDMCPNSIDQRYVHIQGVGFWNTIYTDKRFKSEMETAISTASLSLLPKH